MLCKQFQGCLEACFNIIKGPHKLNDNEAHAEWWVAAVEAMGQEDMAVEEDITCSQEPENIELTNDWCCMSCVLSLHEDFMQMLQHYIEGRGHICMFLPKFHCELKPNRNGLGLHEIL